MVEFPHKTDTIEFSQQGEPEGLHAGKHNSFNASASPLGVETQAEFNEINVFDYDYPTQDGWFVDSLKYFDLDDSGTFSDTENEPLGASVLHYDYNNHGHTLTRIRYESQGMESSQTLSTTYRTEDSFSVQIVEYENNANGNPVVVSDKTLESDEVDAFLDEAQREDIITAIEAYAIEYGNYSAEIEE
jgi:hypothetical protein